jgi:hypothetical protein
MEANVSRAVSQHATSRTQGSDALYPRPAMPYHRVGEEINRSVEPNVTMAKIRLIAWAVIGAKAGNGALRCMHRPFRAGRFF